MKIATAKARQRGIDPALAEEFAHEKLEMLAARFSTLNKISFRSYVNQFLSSIVIRWTKPDAKGGKSRRLETCHDRDDDAPTPVSSLVDRHDNYAAVDVADTLDKARLRLTEKQWRTIRQWSEGRLKDKPVELLIKAQRLIQASGKRQ